MGEEEKRSMVRLFYLLFARLVPLCVISLRIHFFHPPAFTRHHFNCFSFSLPTSTSPRLILYPLLLLARFRSYIHAALPLSMPRYVHFVMTVLRYLQTRLFSPAAFRLAGVLSHDPGVSIF